MLAALAAGMIFFIFNVASIGVRGFAVAVAAIVTAVSLGHYLLWGRADAPRVARERQRFQDQAARSETGETEPPEEFLLGHNGRERSEPLQLLEHSLAATEGRQRSRDGVAVR